MKVTNATIDDGSVSDEMTVHATGEFVLGDNLAEKPPQINRRNKPKKRASNNVVKRRKHSTPVFGNYPISEEKKRSSSLKYYSTGYFYNDAKLTPYVPANQQQNEVADTMIKQESFFSKPKKAAKGLRRTLSMPSFQKKIKEEDGRICEGKQCLDLPLCDRQFATKICHHTDCQVRNEMKPVLLCTECDEHTHSGPLSTHLRFDLPNSGSKLERKTSIHSNNSDSGTEEDSDASYRFDKKNRSYNSARRFFNIAASKNKGRLRKLQSFDQPQDSVKDCFTLQFYDQDENPSTTEKVPVRKGRSIKDSIEPLFDQRGLSLDTHFVFLESSKTPLPLAFDTTPLAGNTLHVKANKDMKVDERIVELMNKTDEQKAQSQRQKKNIISMNDEGSSTNLKAATLPNSNSRLTRKGGITSSTRDLSKSLPDLLQQFKANGFENIAPELLDGSQPFLFDEEDDDDELEKTWTDVIEEKQNMTRQQKIQQEAIWELLSTEHNYVRKIRVIVEVFQRCLYSLQREQFLKEVDSEKLFSNIQDVYDTNRSFWDKYLRQVVEEARRTKEPIKPSQLLDSFARFEDLFDPYIRYCLEESKCVKYLKYLKDTNDHFTEYLCWCENHSQCHRLKLADLLVKPMQRVTKYALLLKAVLTRTIDNDEIISLENMISQVERFVTKINTTLRMRHEEQKLETVLRRLENYSPIEATEEVDRIIADYCNLDLRQKVPGLSQEEPRCILLDGSMKMIEKQGRVDVQVFLFTDLLLITKAKKNGEKFRIIRPPYRLNKIFIHPSKDYSSFVVVYLNEFGVVVTAFTLQVANPELTKWMHAIDKAKKSYELARAGNGSTLDFFDDDLPTTALSAPSFTPSISPFPDRHGIEHSMNGDHSLLPPVIVKDNELPLRSSSSSNFMRIHSGGCEPQEASIKRSMSDPKTSVHPRSREKRNSKQTKARPMSMIQTSDRDTEHPWVFTGEKRGRSGSIPSDVSDDSRQSSGIGDSFRSINSDGGAPIQRDGVKGSNSFTEGSSIQRLKKRFENGDYHSDSSSSLASNGTHNDCTKPISRSNSNKKSNPDFTEHQHTIHEEEEIKIHTSTHFDSDSGDDDELYPNERLDTTRTLHGDDPEDEEDGPYQNIATLKSTIQIMHLNVSTQTDTLQCEKCLAGNGSSFSDSKQDQYCSNTDLIAHVDATTCCEQVDLVDKGTCTETNELLNDIGIQCEVPLTRTIGSQCGDFIQLTGACESETDSDQLRHHQLQNELFYKGDNIDGDSASLPTPMMDALAQSLPEKSIHCLKLDEQERGILKSLSDVNIPLLRGNTPNNVKVVHNRSRSDEPKKVSEVSTRQNHSSISDEEFPGMRALMDLSESLESTVKRTSSGGNKQTMNKQIDTVVENESGEKSNPPSPSLRKLAIVNNSPMLPTKNIPEEQNSSIKQGVIRSYSEIPLKTSPRQTPRSQSDNSIATDSKRYTWHEFDSKALLQGLHDAKFGREKKISKDSKLEPIADEPSRIERTYSKSTEQLNSPRKSKSFKKSILKKFSDSRILDRDDNPVSSSSDTSTDSKQMKKHLKDEKKRAKLEKKLEKKEKKRFSKRRNSSQSSLASSVASLPTSAVTTVKS